VIVRTAVLATVPLDAVMVAFVLALTLVVLTVKVAEVFPAAIVTVAGTVAELRLLDNVTTIPPVGAGPLISTVAVEFLPPATVAGLRVSETIAGGTTVIAVWTENPSELAVIVETA